LRAETEAIMEGAEMQISDEGGNPTVMEGANEGGNPTVMEGAKI
jgi:hypothetical protein